MSDRMEAAEKENGKGMNYAKDSMERMPYEFYMEKYRQTAPVTISNRLGIPYDFSSQEFTVMFMGNLYRITYPEFTVCHVEEDKSYYLLEDDIYAKILVLRYLLSSSIFPHNGDFRSYRELPSGDLYYRQFQGRCILRLNRKYGNRLELFEKIMERLGAVSVKLGDVGYELELFEELYIRFVFWEGDEEFPPSSQILFSSTFPAAFGAYDLAEIGELCINMFSAIERLL